jgi:hypothetical protein
MCVPYDRIYTPTYTSCVIYCRVCSADVCSAVCSVDVCSADVCSADVYRKHGFTVILGVDNTYMPTVYMHTVYTLVIYGLEHPYV